MSAVLSAQWGGSWSSFIYNSIEGGNMFSSELRFFVQLVGVFQFDAFPM